MKTILLVEDDRFLLKAYKAKFESDYRLVVASDGDEALEMLKLNEIDLIILDLVMPKKTGIVFLQQLREIEKHSTIPVIVATNLNREGERQVCEQYGISDFCVKTDVSIDDIGQKVKQALQE